METQRQFKIYLVDDDPFTTEKSKQLLNNIGYSDITVFHSGSDFLDSIIQKPQVVFLDHRMEDEINGFEVLKKINVFLRSNEGTSDPFPFLLE